MAKKAKKQGKKDPRGRKSVEDKMVQISFYRRQSAIKQCGGMLRLLHHLNNEVDHLVVKNHVTNESGLSIQGDLL